MVQRDALAPLNVPHTHGLIERTRRENTARVRMELDRPRRPFMPCKDRPACGWSGGRLGWRKSGRGTEGQSEEAQAQGKGKELGKSKPLIHSPEAPRIRVEDFHRVVSMCGRESGPIG
eukprot:scaffold106389_cov27-Tisochrysis_lutea.AAC.3